jgi:peptide/nickel transport system substrate-binding protein
MRLLATGWAQDFADPQSVIDPTFNGDNIIPAQKSNWPELDVPELNEKIDAAKLVTDPAERARAWADVNHDVMAQAPAIPYMWDYESAVASPNVRGLRNGFSTTWDWSFTSLR